jgi:hypothetical protein
METEGLLPHSQEPLSMLSQNNPIHASIPLQENPF